MSANRKRSRFTETHPPRGWNRFASVRLRSPKRTPRSYDGAVHQKPVSAAPFRKVDWQTRANSRGFPFSDPLDKTQSANLKNPVAASIVALQAFIMGVVYQKPAPMSSVFSLLASRSGLTSGLLFSRKEPFNHESHQSHGAAEPQPNQE